MNDTSCGHGKIIGMHQVKKRSEDVLKIQRSIKKWKDNRETLSLREERGQKKS